ncbi:MAG TPA: hypothetical protein VF607_08565, partial [Verrucomicrobiae bacterium]
PEIIAAARSPHSRNLKGDGNIFCIPNTRMLKALKTTPNQLANHFCPMNYLLEFHTAVII